MSAFAFFYICAPLIYKIFNKFWKIFGVTIFLMLVNSYMINITFNMFSKIGNVSGADMLAGGEPINQLYIFLLGCMVYFVKAWILGNVTRIPRHELPQTLDFSDFLPLFT